MIYEKVKKIMAAALPAILLFLIIACATGTRIFSHSVPKAELGSRLYTVIVYTSAEEGFLKTVAFLDPEGDGYELLPFGAAFNYSVTKGLRGEEAFEMARKEVSFHSAFRTLEVREITVPDGTVVGYELRPLYLPFVYGDSDVLDISYTLQPDGRITAYVDLKQGVERLFSDGDHRRW